MMHNFHEGPDIENIPLHLIAANAVRWHRKHVEACAHIPLTYIDELFEALLVDRYRVTVREIISDLLAMVPDLTECEAVSLARIKFSGMDLDEQIH